MPGSRTGNHRSGRSGREKQGLRIDIQDADLVGTEIGHDEVFVRWVDEDLVGMRRCLTISLGARLVEGPVECLQRGEGAGCRVQFPGRERGSVVRDGEELGAVGAGVDG